MKIEKKYLDAKKGKWLFVTLIIFLMSIATGGDHPSRENHKGKITFFVASAGGAMLRGASSFAICEGGELALGETDSFGAISIAKEMLLMKKCHALLFCKKYHFCGALRTSEEEFFEFEEMYIELAPFAVR